MFKRMCVLYLFHLYCHVLLHSVTSCEIPWSFNSLPEPSDPQNVRLDFLFDVKQQAPEHVQK